MPSIKTLLTIICYSGMKRVVSLLLLLMMAEVCRPQLETISPPVFAGGVSTIHQLRIYDDVLYVSSDRGVCYLPLDGSHGWKILREVPEGVNDFAICGNQYYVCSSQEGEWGCHLIQHPLHPERLFKTQLSSDTEMGFDLLMSPDFGTTWLPVGCLPGPVSLTFNASDEQELLAYGMNVWVDCICPFIFYTDNGGAAWTDTEFQMNEDREQPAAVSQLEFSPWERQTCVAALTTGMAYSRDNGKHLDYTTTSPFHFNHIAFDSQHEGCMYVCGSNLDAPDVNTHKGAYVFRSTNGGRSWESLFQIPSGMARSIISRGGMMYHNGRLYLWTYGSDICVLDNPHSIPGVTNAIHLNEDGHRAGTPSGQEKDLESGAFDLQGRRIVTPHGRQVYVRTKQKVLTNRP